MKPNPNEYNKDAFQSATYDLQDAVLAMWAAGAEEDDIKDEVRNAIEHGIES